jgi:hypothetical protein
VLAPHVRLGQRQEEGGGKGEARLTRGGAPFAPATYIQGILISFYLIGPLVTLIPLGSISSWAFKLYCDDGLLGISPTITILFLKVSQL